MSVHRNSPGRTMITRIMTLDLTYDEKLTLIRFLSRTIEDDPYPLSPRLLPLEAILAKLDRRRRSPNRCHR